MKRKTLLALSLAAALTAGFCAYPAVEQIAERTSLTAEASSGTTTDG
ncbi:MAG: hypothetical protein IKQ91_03485 [Oscillospiraceae bacterium]|nr:hypothetical protein [Oscillospiraceae bacterium]